MHDFLLRLKCLFMGHVPQDPRPVSVVYMRKSDGEWIPVGEMPGISIRYCARCRAFLAIESSK